ncbi:MAG: hypothetical protein J6E31_09255 [Pyramidobacter sp.]|nr:hypothetical protein [Pyramidobacter sp.]
MTERKETTAIYKAAGFINTQTIRPTESFSDPASSDDGSRSTLIAPLERYTFCNIVITENLSTPGSAPKVTDLTDLRIQNSEMTIYKKIDKDQFLIDHPDVIQYMEREQPKVDFGDLLAVEDISNSLNENLFLQLNASKLSTAQRRHYMRAFIARLPRLLTRYDKRLKLTVLRGGRSRKTFLEYLEETLQKEQEEIVRLEHDFFVLPRELATSSQYARRELTRTHADRARDPENAELLKDLNAEEKEKVLLRQDQDYMEFIFSQPDSLEIVAYFAVLKAARSALAKQAAGETLTFESGRFDRTAMGEEFQIAANSVLELMHRDTKGQAGSDSRKRIREALFKFASRAYSYYEKRTGKRAVMEAGTLFKFSTRPLEDEETLENDIKEISAEETLSQENKTRARGANRQPAEIWRFQGLPTGKYWFPLNLHKRKFSFQVIPWNIFDYFLAEEKNIYTACALCMSAFSIIEDVIMQADADEAQAREQHTKTPAVTIPLPFSPRRLALPPHAKNKETRNRYIAQLQEAFAKYYNTEIKINDNGEVEIRKHQERRLPKPESEK